MYSIQLAWKEFSVNLDKVSKYLREHLSSNYDGLICNSDQMEVVFKDTISQGDTDAVNAYWDSVTENSFDPTPEEIVLAKINDAIVFGNKVIVDAAAENILMGITQAGKTKAVSDYCVNLQYYLRTGSLYAAIDEIDALILAVPSEDLAPFITVERLNAYKSKIQGYLS